MILMVDTIACPNCNQLVESNATTCDHCGVDLAIAAVLAESLISQIDTSASSAPISPEALVPRLGEHLLENGFVTQEQLRQALNDQMEAANSGEAILLGQALLKRGHIDRATLDKAVTDQILQLQAALKRSNDHLEQRVNERTIELQNTLEKLTELNQLKYNFVSNVSHELRTPLAHMIGYLDLISSESLGPLTAQQGDALTVLIKAYHRLQDLIDSLLLFSMASQGELSLKKSSISMKELADSIVSQSRTKAREREIEIELNIPTRLPNIIADNEKLTWVLMQLMDNGIKFNQPGGKVEICARRSNHSVRVIVSDTGIGIKEEKLEEIFDTFHQLDNTPSRKYSGTGIGLALAQRIIKAHGSMIEVTSKINEGSRFAFSLPTAEDSK